MKWARCMPYGKGKTDVIFKVINFWYTSSVNYNKLYQAQKKSLVRNPRDTRQCLSEFIWCAHDPESPCFDCQYLQSVPPSLPTVKITEFQPCHGRTTSSENGYIYCLCTCTLYPIIICVYMWIQSPDTPRDERLHQRVNGRETELDASKMAQWRYAREKYPTFQA